MPLAQLHFRSNTLVKQVAATVIIPNVPPPWSTFYLLHGLSDDHTIWTRRTRLEVYAENLPMLIVMPDGYRGFYTRHESGPDYAAYIADEVVDFIERTFNVKRSRTARAIGGLSMGGYGALRIGLGYPDRFQSITSHSGALMHGTHIKGKPPGGLTIDEYRATFGRSPAGTDHDLLHLARRARKAKSLPAIRIDCGTEDFLLDANRTVHAQLVRDKIPHDYEEFPGAHTWDYWDTHIQRALQFHAQQLKLKK